MIYTENLSMNRPKTRRSIGFAAAAFAALLTGCANVHDIEVGSVPDDYRTNHPIMISEKAHNIDIPVASSDTDLSFGRMGMVRGFAADYRENASGSVQIMTPVGSANAAAASRLAGQIKKVLVQEGVPARKIAYQSYQAAAQNDAAPVRLSFTAIGAHTAQCGRWPNDLVLNTMENKHYENFGCATQSNLAAQIANPSDLIAPRGMSPIDAERRDEVIKKYRKFGSTAQGSDE